ncbi:transglycosylase domain-containing protein [Stigmatella aurantiaca]|uniref:transglycosylase domain-containing protein n=1 Tax=Stigmatella aurantiaca TaxID=41 RepID=UPI001FE9985C|nr:transglycosylase domain-containing protein [Stigmatella aurantiaca]
MAAVHALARTENPRTTALMAQRAEETYAAGRKPRVRLAWVSLGAVAPHVVDAVLISEGARFYRHEGVDWTEVKNSLEQSVREARLGRGASTLTQPGDAAHPRGRHPGEAGARGAHQRGASP